MDRIQWSISPEYASGLVRQILLNQVLRDAHIFCEIVQAQVDPKTTWVDLHGHQAQGPVKRRHDTEGSF